ncbi:unnamed protein product [Caenorhabditis sp. 36 PRJEB53466]|nr:unnamed protein product [Caenorhabditis sp. 36 PRJEB53466]
MCIAFIRVARTKLDRYKLILLNNRDEQLHRPTAAMHWHDGILSGVDEQDVARGTWMGLNERGRVGMMLSITQPQSSKDASASSRGGILNAFLNAEDTSEMMESLSETAHKYNGFQLVGIERNKDELYDVKTLTNQQVDTIEVCKWDNEFHVISNSPPSKPYKKAEYGKQLLQDRLQNSNKMTVEEVFEELIGIGTDKTACYPDSQLQLQTANSDEYNLPLSSIFIKYPEGTREYGTRCHTLLAIDQNDRVSVLERRLLPLESTWHDTRFEFVLA